jgi:hypothetical protein
MKALPLILAVLLFGCGSSEDAEGPIVYERGGGIAGHSFRVEVDPGGSAVLTTRQGTEERVEEFELTEDELEAVRSHLADADFDELGDRISEDCFDSYIYSVEYGDERASADSATLSEEFNDATEPIHVLVVERLPPSF